jgi:hypothetical protein
MGTDHVFRAKVMQIEVDKRKTRSVPDGAYLSQNTDASRVRLRSDDWGTIRECLGGFAACGLLRK